jgi:hypothetical protein
MAISKPSRMISTKRSVIPSSRPDFGVATQEGGRPGRDEHPPQLLGRGDADRAARGRGGLHHVFRILDRAQQRRDPLIIGLSFGGQAQRTGGPLDELHAEPALESGDTLRDRRLTRSDQPARGAERAGFDRPDESDEPGGPLENGRHGLAFGKSGCRCGRAAVDRIVRVARPAAVIEGVAIIGVKRPDRLRPA